MVFLHPLNLYKIPSNTIVGENHLVFPGVPPATLSLSVEAAARCLPCHPWLCTICQFPKETSLGLTVLRGVGGFCDQFVISTGIYKTADLHRGISNA